MASYFSMPSAQGEPIKIVPLYPIGEVKGFASPPKLVYNNGPLLSSVQVFTVFWGAAWQQPPLSDYVQSLNSFFDFILTSPLMDQLAEYSTTEQQIGHGRRIGTTVITTSDPGSSVTDNDIQQMLNDAIASNSVLPQPTSQYTLLCVPPKWSRRVHGRRKFLPVVLWLSQRHQWAGLLCCHALSRLLRLHEQSRGV